MENRDTWNSKKPIISERRFVSSSAALSNIRERVVDFASKSGPQTCVKKLLVVWRNIQKPCITRLLELKTSWMKRYSFRELIRIIVLFNVVKRITRFNPTLSSMYPAWQAQEREREEGNQARVKREGRARREKFLSLPFSCACHAGYRWWSRKTNYRKGGDDWQIRKNNLP